MAKREKVKNNTIMKVIPEVSEIIGWVVGPSGKEEKPKISTRKTETQLRVKDGDTIVICIPSSAELLRNLRIKD